ncbi:hypothetical protein [Polluticoccus soli]|uniref:hypothetical protein n=1 Tax=Polluticoccus soli TaxID=3034150 RepID=UPI0023E2CE2B|nr:hypothetical protein [Flavipsychrobacter sp. JY13-12]
MKKNTVFIIAFFAIMLFQSSSVAQPPMKFNYQGIARNASGGAIANQTLGLRISILDSNATGPVLYSETHTPMTNAFGLYTVAIGGGTIASGDINTIPWDKADKYIKIEMDPAGGTTYTDLGTKQLLSVPFAAYASHAALMLPYYDSMSNAGSLFAIQNNDAGPAIEGINNSTAANAFAVRGVVNSTSPGGFSSAVRGINNGTGGLGIGVYGSQAGSGWGVYGTTPDGAGVYGNATNAGFGVFGNSSSGTGVWGTSTSGTAGRFESFSSSNASDVLQVNTTADANGINSTTVSGSSKAAIRGVTTGTNGNAVIGESNNGASAYGIWGISSSGYAGVFSGKVIVSGLLSKGGGSFQIDHPMDPANKYLFHSFVESPDMMNVYNGNITTDANGVAVVSLPAYFEVENIDFKYQLTVIGQFAQAIISKEVAGNKFEVKTDKPNVKVSWQVTGVRNDKFAQKNRIVAEVEKAPNEKGFYLHPELYNLPFERSIPFSRVASGKE